MLCLASEIISRQELSRREFRPPGCDVDLEMGSIWALCSIEKVNWCFICLFGRKPELSRFQQQLTAERAAADQRLSDKEAQYAELEEEMDLFTVRGVAPGLPFSRFDHFHVWFIAFVVNKDQKVQRSIGLDFGWEPVMPPPFPGKVGSFSCGFSSQMHCIAFIIVCCEFSEIIRRHIKVGNTSKVSSRFYFSYFFDFCISKVPATRTVIPGLDRKCE